eukprot:CAMPEP_0117532710 /NCGR_PEP_ID=MMETSP0784-20121206/39508_1 /TAXON_ID=39447 /ORGANISM="" /LENGTH=121 /DNA_ID=CAMNT_0005329111 /DNA_START=462 /DNA_END=827 /DNA_ORIENTATION=-
MAPRSQTHRPRGMATETATKPEAEEGTSVEAGTKWTVELILFGLSAPPGSAHVKDARRLLAAVVRAFHRDLLAHRSDEPSINRFAHRPRGEQQQKRFWDAGRRGPRLALKDEGEEALLVVA